MSGSDKSKRRLQASTLSNGFVAFVRSYESRGLLRDEVAFALLAWIAFHARHSDGRNDGVAVGEMLLGRASCASDLQKTEGQIREALRRLERGGFVTCQATSRGTRVTLENAKVFDIGRTADNQPNSRIGDQGYSQVRNRKAPTKGKGILDRESGGEIASFPIAPHPQESLTIEILSTKFPGADVPYEAARALAKKRKENGPDAALDLAWFAKHWLPKCGPKVTKLVAPVQAKQAEDGPPGWREELERMHPGNPINAEQRQWSTLPASKQAEVMERLSHAKDPAA